MLSDAEYREFLDALARKHLRLSKLRRKHFTKLDQLSDRLSHLQNIRRLLSVAQQDIEDTELLEVLAKKLEKAYLEEVLNHMDQCGVFDAIEEDSQTLFANIRRSMIPDEDIEMLRAAGVDDPEAEILLIIHYCRTHLGQDRYSLKLDARNSVETVRQADLVLDRVAKLIGSNSKSPSPDQPESKKKRKWLNGVGKILSGGVLGAGNVLLGCGSLNGPNTGIAYLILGSSAAAVGSICQGLGDLRGE